MNGQTDFRTGTLTFSEWSGFWKVTPEATLVTDQEWDEAVKALRAWLSTRYLVEWSLDWRRHCCVEGDFAEPERTIKVTIEVAGVLSMGFLKFVQQWLQNSAPSWRISIPTDNTNKNLILVYPNAIRINPEAEADLDRFLTKIGPKLAKLIEDGRRRFNIRDKPIPPLPAE